MDMMDLVEIGKRIKSLRNESKLTQNKIAEYLSLDQSMIAKMEKGERNITSDVVEKLSALFCCTVDYILFGDNQEQQCAVSFRTNDLTADDLKSLAIINKIALNQFEMDKMLEAH
ncbi:helix-turn-helix transcriptional regulator [Tuanshanicoccus lijuaniae]|uniref:helix-turn-helix domain-containing protein n=1 Tax=Aerococcaceae bacterium zg-1292 TaxID=2774330 RepID=UPI0019361DA1|nr:helix-turn-helix transcriptional regulator [Aerococcaceae bacterium zg-A91]MBS4458767.1 helix-turn-helix transcriptional regulator [Aerococcaceae bacterium zg-BR33]QQA36679.1 helix-turn-helix transcriptional regulator [Aerococcaceae bacterium zg-1292]